VQTLLLKVLDAGDGNTATSATGRMPDFLPMGSNAPDRPTELKATAGNAL